jgi:glycerophosphoryl diester phosphodiesterase
MAAAPTLAFVVWLACLLVAVAAAQRRGVAAIGHRGSPQERPENTMASFERAIELGATHVEVDVRTSADGVLVNIHDSTVDRTTNGTGRVRQLTLAELKALDAGAWFAPQYAGERVPTVAEVLDLLRRRNVSYYLDFKDGAAPKLYADMVAAGVPYQGVVYSGPYRLKELQRTDVGVRVMPQAVGPRVLARSIEFFAPLTAVNFGNELDPEAVPLAQAIGADIFVNCFGERDSDAGYQAAIDGGATGIQTDRMGALVAYLRANGYYP